MNPQGGIDMGKRRKLLVIPVLSIALLCIVSGVLLGGTTGKISGVVRDKNTGEPLPGVAVSIKGEQIGSLTDSEGR
jgi:hypothetical protein